VQDDNIGANLWRIHDKIYDFQNFVDSHPGGSHWLIKTKGTDITEAFETSHVVNPSLVESMLSKFFVKDATEPRNSPYTFNSTGFYKTLKRKIQPILKVN